jgi:signal transduction histidine kinase
MRHTGTRLASGAPRRGTVVAATAGVRAAETDRQGILVVDDEPEVARSVRDLLRLDYRVHTATRASDGMDILDKEDIAVVLTDQRMPDMTGVELLSHVRENHPATTRLLFTAYSDIRAVVDAINQGSVYRYITKPWDADELHTIVRDAVERRHLIAERERLLAELEYRNEALERANADLAELSDLKSNFINVASHELRTPLAILLPLTYLAMRTPDVQTPLAGYLQTIWCTTDRMRHLVDQITTMLAVGRFDRPLVRESVLLQGLLDAAAEDVEAFVKLRRQVLVREQDGDLGRVAVEAPKIRDGISHLLLNAIKFTPDEGRITLTGRRTADGGAEIAVSDTGCGIDAQALRHIFDPFFTQLDISKHSSGVFEHGRRGLGLGLSMVKAFVDMHGGHIDVQSELGRGSTFTIVLPPHAVTDAEVAGSA